MNRFIPFISHIISAFLIERPTNTSYQDSHTSAGYKKLTLGILCFMFLLLQQASAQELNCTNRIDDDGDGLIDCADNNCNCFASAYPCDTKYYILRANAITTSSTDLIQVNISNTGVVTLVNLFTYTQSLNALVYFRGYLYAMDASGTTLYRLDKLGNIVSLGTPTGLPTPASNWSGAAVTRAGIMYVIEGRAAGNVGQRRLYRINLLPGGAYTATLVGNTGVVENVGDMAIDELGVLYGYVEERNGVASNNAGLYSFNTTTAAATRLSTIPYTYSNLGSLFYSLSGTSGRMYGYGHDNDPTRTQNTFYEVDYLGTGALTTLSVSTGVTRSDGCSCPWKLALSRYADVSCIAQSSTFNWQFDFNNQSGGPLANVVLRDTLDTRFSYNFNVATTQTTIRAIYGNAATVTLGSFGGGTNNVLTITGVNVPVDYTSLPALSVSVSATAIFTFNETILEQAYITGIPQIYGTYIKSDYPFPPLNSLYDLPEDPSPVYAVPVWSATNTGPYCTGATIQLSATAGFTSYSWTGPSAFTSTLRTPTRSAATVAMSGVYTVSVSDNNGCSSTSTTNVIVNSATAAVTGTNVICAGTSTTLTASGGGTYLWSTGATSASISPSPTITTTYSVAVTATNGCTATANRVVTVNANPTVNITGTTAICSGASTTLTANATAGSGTITGYTWSNGQSGATQTTITVNTAGTYVVTVTNSNGCTATASITVTVNALPVVSITGANPICLGATTTLSPTTSGTWTSSNTAVATVSNAGVVTGISGGTATFTFTQTSTGCTSLPTAAVTVNALPVVSITGANPICVGATTALSPTTGGTWTSSNTAVATVTNAGVVTGVSGGTVTFTFTNSTTGCTSLPTTAVTVNALPVIGGSSFTNPTICGGSQGTITLTGLAASTTYTVNYVRNGSAATPISLTTNASGQLTITSLNAGSYTNFTVTTAAGCTSTPLAGPITLTDPSGANTTLTVNPNPVCKNSTLTISVSAVAGATYNWSGNGIVNTNTNSTTAVPTINGTQAYSVTITTLAGCVSNSTTNVTVNALPVVSITGANPICVGTTTTLSPTTGGTWASSNTAVATVTNAGVVTGVSSGTSTFTFTNTTTGCVSAATPTVTVNALPIASFTANGVACSTGAVGTAINFASTSLSGSGTVTTYAWNFGASATPTTASTPTQAVTYTTAGVKTITLTVTNSNGCTASTSCSVTISNPSTCNAAFTINNANQCLTGNSFIFTNTSTASPSGTITAYSWTFGTGATPTTSSLVGPNTVTYSNAGIKTISLTITDSNGCTTTTSLTVTVYAMPTATITPATATICSGTPQTLTASGGNNYVWNTGDNTAAITVSPTTTTTYTVTTTDANGCTASANRIVTVNATPTAGITLAETSGVANNDGIICAGASVQLTGTGGATYAWSGAAIGTPSSNPQNILPTATGTYTVTVSSAAGCTATASRLITVNALPTATIVPGGGGSVCNTQSGLTLTASGGTSYLWSTGSTTAAVNIASNQPTTTYTVTVTNSNNCSATTNVIVNAVGTGSCNQPPIAINDINNTFINTPISGQVLTNDSDPDAGQTLTVNTTPSGVSGGTVVLNSNGTYTFTPTPGFTGVAQFTYTVCDNGTPQACDQATVSINVIENTIANNPPAPGNDVIQTLINTTVTGTLATNDIDPDGNINPTGFTLVTPPSASAGVLTLNPNGTYTFVPTTGFTGTATFTYQVCDLGMPVLCANATGVIEVYPDNNGPANNPPNAQDDATIALVNTPVTINGLINDSDPNGDLIAITSVTSPTSGSVSISGGNFIYTPAAGFVGTASFTYQICDSGAPTLCDNATVYVTVLPVPPLAENDINNTLLNTPVTGNVATNDENLLVGFTVNTSPTSPNYGSVVFNSDGTYVYTPNLNYVGEDSFQYEICNLVGLCDIATVYINITANTSVNNPPASSNDVVQTLINTTVTGSVGNNDIDPDGNINPNGFTLTTPPTTGTLTFNTDGTFSFVPATGFVGTTTFTYQVCDLGTPVLCSTATATIEVLPDLNGTGNNPPNAQDDAFGGTVNSPITGNVLTNDSDPNGNTLTVNTTPVVNVPPSAGTLVLNSNGTFTFTPASGFTGTTSFVYQVCDNGSPSLCDEATVYITVLPVPPLAENDINNVLPNTSVTGNVATNDENLLVGFTVNTTPVSAPSHGTVSLNADGTYTYTPTNGSTYIGVDSFRYEICNPGGLCDIATVYINITANTSVNNPPAPGNDVVQTLINTTVTGSVGNNDIDPDGNINPTGFTLTTPPSATAGTLTFNANGTFSFVPATGFVGTTTFTYQVCDLGTPVLCSTATATIEVLPDLNGTGNNPPNAQDDAFGSTGNSPITGNVLTNDSDPNGNTLTVNTTPIVNVPPSAGTLVLNSNGTFTFTPASGFTGTTSFVYQVCDNGSPSLCDEATVYITVFNCALTAGSCVPQNDECQLNQGQVRIQAQGGKLPYSVTWTPAHGTPAQPAQILIDGGSLLIDGLHGNTTYLFTVTDADGCHVP